MAGGNPCHKWINIKEVNSFILLSLALNISIEPSRLNFFLNNHLHLMALHPWDKSCNSQVLLDHIDYL